MKLLKNLRLPLLASIGLLVLILSCPRAGAAAITKADNTNALGTAASWVGGALPGAADVATWSGAYSASPNNATGLTNSLRAVNSGTAISVQGIAVGALTGTALTTNTIYWGTSGAGAETNISAAAHSGSLVTITTKANHGYAPGQEVTIAGVTPAGYNGTFKVVGILSATQFTYSNTVSGLTAGTAFGTVESAIYIGGAGTTAANSSFTIGSSGIDLSARTGRGLVSEREGGWLRQRWRDQRFGWRYRGCQPGRSERDGGCRRLCRLHREMACEHGRDPAWTSQWRHRLGIESRSGCHHAERRYARRWRNSRCGRQLDLDQSDHLGCRDHQLH
jgi:hypothetical protein